MKSARLKTYLTLMKPSESRNKYGGKDVDFEVTKTVHAERVKYTGKMGVVVGETFVQYDADYNIRDVHEVKEGWRVQERDGYLYTVDHIIPNHDRGFVTLNCIRVNE